MKKQVLNKIDEIIDWCPCVQGCHLCSGTGRLIGNKTTVKELYEYYIEHPDFKGQTFNQWMGEESENGYYIISKELKEKLL